MMRFFRACHFSLRTFLILVATVALLGGVAGRWYLGGVKRVVFRGMKVGPYEAFASWDVLHSGAERLCYVVFMPRQSRINFGDSGSVVALKQSGAMGLKFIHPPPWSTDSGLFYNQVRVSGSDRGAIFMYLHSRGELREIPVSVHASSFITVETMENLATTAVWDREIKPILDAESIEYLKSKGLPYSTIKKILAISPGDHAAE